MQIQLPKLKKVNLDRPKKKKILLLSDDLRLNSGIATMSREIVVGTAHHFDWVQLGAAMQHPDHGKIFDLSDEINRERGIDHASVRIYAHTGYGTPEVLREVLAMEKPDAILHFTDPRFWEWLYMMDYEIRHEYGIPLMYYNIWDDAPAPMWNKPFYQSCDLLMNISKQTNNLVKLVLGQDDYTDLYEGDGGGKRLVAYVPHGIPQDRFFPITEAHPDWAEYKKFVDEFKRNNNVDFIVYWNNRNVRRKQPGDVILAFRRFCDGLPVEQRKRVALFMHTQLQDPNGTDLMAVKKAICPDYKVIFNQEVLPTKVMNFFYNMADVTLNIASNEGFGLSSAESIMAGTPVINNVTGGLQDQCRFQDETGAWINFAGGFTSNHTGKYKVHGPWVKPVFPSNRSLQGSVPTPYIFDDRCRFEDVADAIRFWYDLGYDGRKDAGAKGREWLLSEESGMSARRMCERMVFCIDACLERFQPKPSVQLVHVKPQEKFEEIGITW
jgi:glycosyltransferase involved in cell wall biosynthesis